jgi:hypothetical protein
VSITSPISNRTATVRVENFDPSYRNLYIQSAMLDGKLFGVDKRRHEQSSNRKEYLRHVRYRN